MSLPALDLELFLGVKSWGGDSVVRFTCILLLLMWSTAESNRHSTG